MRTAVVTLLLSLFLGASALAAPVTKTAVLDVPGVEKISVDYPARTVSVAYDAERTNVMALLKATADAGYPAKLENQVKP